MVSEYYSRGYSTFRKTTTFYRRALPFSYYAEQVVHSSLGALVGCWSVLGEAGICSASSLSCTGLAVSLPSQCIPLPDTSSRGILEPRMPSFTGSQSSTYFSIVSARLTGIMGLRSNSRMFVHDYILAPLSTAPTTAIMSTKRELCDEARRLRNGKSQDLVFLLISLIPLCPVPASTGLYANDRRPTRAEKDAVHLAIISMDGCAWYDRRRHSNWCTDKERRLVKNLRSEHPSALECRYKSCHFVLTDAHHRRPDRASSPVDLQPHYGGH